MPDIETAEEILEDLEDVDDDDLEEIEALLEDIGEEDDDLDLELMEEDDDDDLEAIERRRRRRRRRSRARTRKVPNLWLRKLRGLATKTEVRALGRRTRAEIQRVNRKVTRNTNRIRAQSSLNSRQSRAIRSVRKKVDNTQQMFLLTSLLGSDKTYKVPDGYQLTQDIKISTYDNADIGATKPTGFAVIPAGTYTIEKDAEIDLKEAGDSLDRLLPFLLMGGLGGTAGGGMMENPLMLVLLLDALK